MHKKLDRAVGNAPDRTPGPAIYRRETDHLIFSTVIVPFH